MEQWAHQTLSTGRKMLFMGYLGLVAGVTHLVLRPGVGSMVAFLSLSIGVVSLSIALDAFEQRERYNFRRRKNYMGVHT